MTKRRRTTEGGFTLMEVALAVFILAGSLATLIALESSAMERAVRDRSIQQAMLIARRVMADFEAGKRPADEGRSTGSAVQMLEHAGALSQEDNNLIKQLEPFDVETDVELWELPAMGNQPADARAFKRIEVTVSWGEASADRFQLVYFINNVETDPV